MAQAAVLERPTGTMTEESESPEAIAHRKRSSELYNRFFSANTSDEAVAEAVAATFAPATEAEPVRRAEPKQAPARADAPLRTRELFTNLDYKDHTLIHTEDRAEVAVPQAPKVEPAAPAQTETEEEDLRPTPRTMETLHRANAMRQDSEAASEQHVRVGFFASLSSKAKLALAIVAAAVVVAIALVCINTGIINSIQSDISAKAQELQGLEQYSEELKGRIEQYNDPDYVDYYAENVLQMTREP